MSPAVSKAVAAVLRQLDAAVKQSVLRRVDAMERELSFMSGRREQNLLLIRGRGWTDARLELVFVLNSFYQQVLGPLQAAARGGPEGLGRTIPIRHGTNKFDADGARAVEATMREFQGLLEALGLERRWLYSNTCGELVFAIAAHEPASQV